MSYTPVTSNTLLSYALDTLPNPLQASPATGNTVYAALTFSVSNNTAKVISVSKIQFTLPVGTLAQDITNNPAAVIGAVSPAGIWNIAMTSPGVYTAVPASGTPVIVTTDGIIMQLYNIPVNQQTGSLSITISETASDTSDPLQARLATFVIAKFPYGFFFRNLAPNAGQIPDKGTVTLSWEGSDMATYFMDYDGSPVDVTNLRTWKSPELSNDTTFLLTAMVTSLGQKVTAVLSVTVIVSNPEINAASLSVSGPATLQGPTVVDGSLNANKGITVGGAAVLNNSLQVGGTSTMSSLTVNQQLTASGGISASQVAATGLAVNGNASVAGTLVAGNLQTMGAGKLIFSGASNWGGTYIAQTDGLVCGYVQPPGNNNTLCLGYIYGSANGITVSALGGVLCALFQASGSSVTGWMNTNTNSFTLPVPKGMQFSISAGFPGNNSLNPTVFFYWVPFGSGGYSKIADVADHPENVAPHILDNVISGNINTYTHAPAVSRLMEVLSDIFGEKLDAELKVRLSEAVKALVYEEGKKTVHGIPKKTKKK